MVGYGMPLESRLAMTGITTSVFSRGNLKHSYLEERL